MKRGLLLLIPALAFAQEPAVSRNELAFQLGGLTSSANLGPGVGLQANYGRRLWVGRNAALYSEVHLLASAQRIVDSADNRATRDVASLYITPGVRLKFFPTATLSPYLAVGGGVAWYEQSRTDLAGRTNPAPRELLRGAFDFGGGADLRVRRWLSLRSEIRDFYTGVPAYNLVTVRGGQHNPVAGAALVIGWH